MTISKGPFLKAIISVGKNCTCDIIKVTDIFYMTYEACMLFGTHNLGAHVDMGKELFLSELVEVVFLLLMLPPHCLSFGLYTQNVIMSRVTVYELLVIVQASTCQCQNKTQITLSCVQASVYQKGPQQDQMNKWLLMVNFGFF